MISPTIPAIHKLQRVDEHSERQAVPTELFPEDFFRYHSPITTDQAQSSLCRQGLLPSAIVGENLETVGLPSDYGAFGRMIGMRWRLKRCDG